MRRYIGTIERLVGRPTLAKPDFAVRVDLEVVVDWYNDLVYGNVVQLPRISFLSMWLVQIRS